MYIVRRSTHNPILAPQLEYPWEAQATFNPSPVKKGKAIYILYRAIGSPDPLTSPGEGVSTIGRAISLDDRHFGSREQFIVPEKEWEKYGCEDPRVTYFEKKYYIFYTALSEKPFRASGIKVACAVSKDLSKVDSKHLVTPFNAKAMTLFPERIDGKVAVILTAHTDEPPVKVAIALADRVEDFFDEDFWIRWHADIDTATIPIGRNQNDHFEVGAAPIKTKDGWLLVYSYIKNYLGGGSRVFGIEALLLDLKDPRKIIGRTLNPILVPEESYERFGSVGNIIFPSGALLQKNGRLDIYYGGADTISARASVSLKDLLAAMKLDVKNPLVARFKGNPIINPDKKHPFETRATFNPAAIDLGGNIHILYRAMSDDNTSVLGYAKSKNGLSVDERSDKPAYIPREPFEMKHGSQDGNSGCEDPRLTVLGKTVYLAYTAYDGVSHTRVALSSISTSDFVSKKFDKWSKPILITPGHIDDKDLCLFPKKVNGKYMFLHRVGVHICADFTDDLLFKNNLLSRCIEVMGPRDGTWESEKIGIAAPPIETDAGWLLIYHGVSKTKKYRLGAALLDLKNPTVLLARSIDPIFVPETKYEKEGQIPNVVFSCGAVKRGKTIYMYYGGGDSVIGVATFSLPKILKLLRPSSLRL